MANDGVHMTVSQAGGTYDNEADAAASPVAGICQRPSSSPLRSLESPVIHADGQALRAMVYSVRRS